MENQEMDRHRIVIVGGGFGGLYAAKSLRRVDAQITLIDRRNFHLFQPLLYQVATGGISPGDIASPLRGVFRRHKQTRVWQAEVTDIDTGERRVILDDGSVDYDTLIVATGVRHAYFGHDDWERFAPGLKSIEDALDIRRRIFLAFEAAERETDPGIRDLWMTFVIVGGGPTGVELAGALAELAHRTLRDDFRSIDPRDARIVLIEGMHRILPSYPPELSAEAEGALAKLGVTLRKQCRVTSIEEKAVTFEHGDREERIEARTILWAAGIQASPLGRLLQRKTGAPLDGAGRVIVQPDLTIPGHPEIFVIGDLAHFAPPGQDPLPGVAPVAMQQGRHAAQVIRRRLGGGSGEPFRYRDKGNLTVIGRHAAVADLSRFRFAGYPAWLAWVFTHIWYLIEFDNKILVMVQWAFDYLTRKRGARLITSGEAFPGRRNERTDLG